MNPTENAWQVWKEVVPAKLARQNPLVILRILELGDNSDGIFQMELRVRLGVNQSYLSKLIRKLVDAEWTKVSASESGRGRCLVKTTASGRRVLKRLWAKLVPATRTQAPVAPRGGVRKRISEQRGQLSFGEILPSSENETPNL